MTRDRPAPARPADPAGVRTGNAAGGWHDDGLTTALIWGAMFAVAASAMTHSTAITSRSPATASPP